MYALPITFNESRILNSYVIKHAVLKLFNSLKDSILEKSNSYTFSLKF